MKIKQNVLRSLSVLQDTCVYHFYAVSTYVILNNLFFSKSGFQYS